MEFSCDRCGELFEDAKEIDFVYSTEWLPDGTKVEKSEPQMVSPCCEETYSDETFNAHKLEASCEK